MIATERAGIMARTAVALACALCALWLSVPASAVSVAKVLGCEGDSQTVARNPVSQAQTYCALTASRLGWSYYIFAASGSTSHDVISRLPADLAAPGCCDCFLVQVGANDSFIDPSTPLVPEWPAPVAPSPPAMSVQQFAVNLSAIAATVRAANVPIAFLTQWAFFSSPEIVQEQFYVDAMKDAAAQLDPPVPVVDMFALQIGGLWWNYRDYQSLFWMKYETDYQHPSASGHALEAAQLAKPRYATTCAYRP